MKHLFLFISFVLVCQIALSQDVESIKKKLNDGDYKTAKADLSNILQKDGKNKTALQLRAEAKMGLEDL